MLYPDAMDELSTNLKMYLICWQKYGEDVSHFKAFADYFDAMDYLETLGPARDFNHKFLAQP